MGMLAAYISASKAEGNFNQSSHLCNASQEFRLWSSIRYGQHPRDWKQTLRSVGFGKVNGNDEELKLWCLWDVASKRWQQRHSSTLRIVWFPCAMTNVRPASPYPYARARTSPLPGVACQLLADLYEGVPFFNSRLDVQVSVPEAKKPLQVSFYSACEAILVRI